MTPAELARVTPAELERAVDAVSAELDRLAERGESWRPRAVARAVADRFDDGVVDDGYLTAIARGEIVRRAGAGYGLVVRDGDVAAIPRDAMSADERRRERRVSPR